jgi:hypothetical protein
MKWTLGTIGVVLLASTTAGAGTLTTSLVFSSGTTATGVACSVTNIGTKPTTVTAVQLFDLFGTEIALEGNDCPVPPATLPPHASCQGLKDPFASAGYCTATAGGKFRLSLNLFTEIGNNTIETVQGTK